MVEKVFLTVLVERVPNVFVERAFPKCGILIGGEGIPKCLRGEGDHKCLRGEGVPKCLHAWRGYSISVFEERTFPSVFLERVLIPKFLPGEGIPKCLCGEDVPKCLRGEDVPDCTGGEDVPNCWCEDICCSVRDGVAILFWCLDLQGSSEETAVLTSLLTGILR